MVTITYERVEHSVSKTVPCRVCGRKLKRSTTLGQTINPWNKNDDGTPKNRYQIMAELEVEAEAWKPANNIHAKCREVEAGTTESAAS